MKCIALTIGVWLACAILIAPTIGRALRRARERQYGE